MERIAMSQQERDRLEWLKQARDKRLTQSVVAERMGVSERWVRKMGSERESVKWLILGGILQFHEFGPAGRRVLSF